MRPYAALMFLRASIAISSTPKIGFNDPFVVLDLFGDAFRDIHDILEAEGAGPSVVLHCWTGGPKWSRRFAELDVTFSFAGPVAFETGDTVRRGAAVIDPSRVVVETDTPYLAPPPHRESGTCVRG